MAGPACVIGNPDCHNSAKTGCNALSKAMRKKFRKQEIQSRAKYGEISSKGSVSFTPNPHPRLLAKNLSTLGFYLLRRKDTATAPLTTLFLDTSAILFIFAITQHGVLIQDQLLNEDYTADE